MKEEVNARVNGPMPQFKQKLESAEKGIEKLAHDVGKNIGSFATDVENKTTEYVESSKHYVQENPGKSVAIAAAAGVVAGSLLTLLMRRRH